MREFSFEELALPGLSISQSKINTSCDKCQGRGYSTTWDGALRVPCPCTGATPGYGFCRTCEGTGHIYGKCLVCYGYGIRPNAACPSCNLYNWFIEDGHWICKDCLDTRIPMPTHQEKAPTVWDHLISDD